MQAPPERSGGVEGEEECEETGPSDTVAKRGKTEGDLSTYSLEDLKQLCREANLKVSGNKSQLIERLKGNV